MWLNHRHTDNLHPSAVLQCVAGLCGCDRPSFSCASLRAVAEILCPLSRGFRLFDHLSPSSSSPRVAPSHASVFACGSVPRSSSVVARASACSSVSRPSSLRGSIHAPLSVRVDSAPTPVVSSAVRLSLSRRHRRRRRSRHVVQPSCCCGGGPRDSFACSGCRCNPAACYVCPACSECRERASSFRLLHRLA